MLQDHEGLLSRWYAYSARRADLMLMVILGISVAAAFLLYNPKEKSLRLEIDPSVERLLAEDSQEHAYYQEQLKRFGSDEILLLAIEGPEVFTEASMQRLRKLRRALRRVPGVHDVLSLANAPNVKAEEDAVGVNNFGDADFSRPDTPAALKHDLQSNPLFAGRLVSDDARIATVIVTFDGVDDREFLRQGLVEQVREAAEKVLEGSDATLRITGSQAVKAATSEALLKQFAYILPALIIILDFFLLLAFRSWRGVLIPLMGIGLTLLWTMALMVLFGKQINLVTSLVPPVIVTIGLAYAMHVLNEYFVLAPEGEESVHRTQQLLEAVGLPLLVTGLTTAAGFLALALSPLPAIREFAFFSAAGVLIAVAMSLTFLPSALRFWGCGPLKALPGQPLFDGLASMLAEFNTLRRRPIILMALIVALIAIYGASQIQVGTNYINDFSEETQVRQDYEVINQKLGGANVFSVVLEGVVDDTFARPMVLREIQTLQRWLESQPEIDVTTSMVDHLVLISRSLNGGDEAFFEIPESASDVKQYLLFGGGDELDGYVDRAFRHARIEVQANVQDTALIRDLNTRIEARLRKLPNIVRGRTTGNSILITQAVDEVASGQWMSIGVALLVVYLMLGTLFTSWRVGLLAMLPNFLPVIVYFGALGFSGVTLNPTTSLIACIVLGIAVDDTVHYLARFNAEARNTASETKATYSTLRQIIRPVTLTSVTLCLGFLVLAGSDLQNQVQFGLLAAFTLLVAWITDITVTPALASGVKIVTLWDVLRLDLGRSPQHSIPLFDGLSIRQARIFALMSDIQTMPSGTRVITEGEEGGDIYIVIEGELSVWVERDDERVELNTMRRGMTIGEVGHFGSRRTANIDAVTNVRLLRFNDSDLERMVKRVPKIAAIVFRNLNRIQAQRITRSMNRSL